jgi:large subunit ribosomal protein L17
MRHGAKINHLGRKTPHRKALMRNLACQLIQHKRIVTTLAKAKALRVFVEPLLTKSKEDTTHQRRVVFSYLQDKEALKELFSTVNTKIANRPGGYCRIIKLEKRVGDAADMAMIELVDFNEIYNAKETVGEEKKKTRRGRPKKVAEAKTEVKTEAPAPVAVEESAVVEDVVAEMPAVAEEVVVAEMPAVAEDVVAETPAADDTTATETPSEDQKEEPLA